MHTEVTSDVTVKLKLSVRGERSSGGHASRRVTFETKHMSTMLSFVSKDTQYALTLAS